MKTTNRASRKAGKKSPSAQSAKSRKSSQGFTLDKRKRLLKICQQAANNIRQAHSADPETAALEKECLSKIEGLQNRLLGIPDAEKAVGRLAAPAPVRTTLNTMSVAIDMADAFALYQVSVNAAGAFALIVVDNIKRDAHAFDGWQDFDSHPDFAAGLNELARVALSNASTKLKAKSEFYAPMIERLRAFNGSIAIEELDPAALVEVFERYCGNGPSNMDLEESVNSMNDLIELVCVTMSERWKQDGGSLSWFMGQIVKKELSNALTRLCDALRDAHKAIIALGLQSEQCREAA
jgi:hypothetical protein